MAPIKMKFINIYKTARICGVYKKKKYTLNKTDYISKNYKKNLPHKIHQFILITN